MSIAQCKGKVSEARAQKFKAQNARAHLKCNFNSIFFFLFEKNVKKKNIVGNRLYENKSPSNSNLAWGGRGNERNKIPTRVARH